MKATIKIPAGWRRLRAWDCQRVNDAWFDAEKMEWVKFHTAADFVFGDVIVIRRIARAKKLRKGAK